MRQYQGQTLDNGYVLGGWLGGSSFVSTREGSPVVVRLLESLPAAAEHPHLLPVLDRGQTSAGGDAISYLVTPRADEVLADALAERPLDESEAIAIAEGVVPALEYLHGKGLVHSRIRPSNLFAIGDTLYLSADRLRAATEEFTPASDLRELGLTLIECVTRRRPPIGAPVPSGLSPRVSRLAAYCLSVEPTVDGLKQLLAPAAPAPQAPARRPPVMGVIAVSLVLAAAFLWFMKKPGAEEPAVKTQEPVAEAPAPPRKEPAKPEPVKRPEVSSIETKPVETKPATTQQAVGQPMPQPNQSALRSIRGRIKVEIRADFDASGNVSNATFASQGPSKYFADLSRDAVLHWRFAEPPRGPVIITFEFTESGITTSTRPAGS